MKRMFHTRLLVSTLLFLLSFVCAPVVYATTEAEQALGIMSLCKVISDFYTWTQNIVGLGLFLMFLGAGLGYIVPQIKKYVGEPAAIAQNAVIGTLILFGAVAILNTLNADLAKCDVTALPQSTQSNSSTDTQGPSNYLVTRKTTTGQTFYFLKAGGTCGATTACEPGFSCTNGICTVAEPGSLPLHSWCLLDSQCAGGNTCVSEFNFRIRPGSSANKCCAASEIAPASGDNVPYCTK